MKHLFFDTETTGKADFRAAPDAHHQPRIVQLAAMLCDASGNELSVIDVTIKPDGWIVPLDVSALHGITTAIAAAHGVPILEAMRVFLSLARISKTVIAHNIDFDLMMVQGEAMRLKIDLAKWPDRFCTMRAMTNHCKLPGPYGYKWPKLQEAYTHAFANQFDGAHGALADVRACKEIYFWMNDRKSLVTP